MADVGKAAVPASDVVEQMEGSSLQEAAQWVIIWLTLQQSYSAHAE